MGSLESHIIWNTDLHACPDSAEVLILYGVQDGLDHKFYVTASCARRDRGDPSSAYFRDENDGSDMGDRCMVFAWAPMPKVCDFLQLSVGTE